MTDSMSLSLITAHITFIDTQLVLIHIPIEHYSIFVQPILRLLFGEDHDQDAGKIPWTNRHEFFNLSITTLECSIICSKYLAEKYIFPVQKTLESFFRARSSKSDGITIFPETYIVVQVDGQGLDAGQRVLELTGPLAMAGISIFFVTTYFCDYILVPSKARRTVTVTLEQRGFVFSKDEDAFVSQLSPTFTHGHARKASSSSDESPSQAALRFIPTVPPTPPAKDIDELQSRTFRKLKKNKIEPLVDETLKLVSCAGDTEHDSKKNERLKNDLLQVLLSTPKGAAQKSKNCCKQVDYINTDDDESDEIDMSVSFLSLTITAEEPISILLEERLLPRLGKSLYGAKDADDILVPIIFDLSHLAFETTGIVGGVAGRLSQGKGRQGSYVSDGDLSPTTPPSNDYGEDSTATTTEISFLSTARAGTVIVKASQLEKAVKELTLALDEISA